MAINLSNVIAQINTRFDNIDSSTSLLEQHRINSARNRMNASGRGLLTYRSTGHLPPLTDSAYIGSIVYVEEDNVFGDSSGAFYSATTRDSGWFRLELTQDASEALIPADSAGNAPVPVIFQGTNYGYSMGGGSNPYTQDIDNYPFASDANATNVGEMTNPNSTANWSGTGGGSATDGYHIGGSPVTPFSSPIYKFPYAATTPVTVTDTGNDVAANQMHRYGHLEMVGDRTGVYILGGYRGPSYPTLANKNTILKFNASTDGSTIDDVGDLTAAKRANMTGSSSTHGYSAGGYISAVINVIEKFPFADASANAADVGDMLAAGSSGSASSSDTHGYIAGHQAPSQSNVIQKYSFASDGNSTDVGDLFQSKSIGAGASSTTHGYLAGGSPATDTIQKYSFATDENATDVGNLPFARRQNAGSHY